jgi:hypothetical protein
MERLLRDGRLRKLLEHGDEDLARECQEGGCGVCGGVLHSAKYERKPRGLEGVEGWDRRHSFCCEKEGCRKRHTPPSLRFLGRKVYVGVVVVLVAAMMHGPNARRVAQLRDALGIDRRTLARWRQWWLNTFVQKPFWKARRGRFMPVLDEAAMPFCLVDAFKATRREGLIRLMEFLSASTTDCGKGVAVM